MEAQLQNIQSATLEKPRVQIVLNALESVIDEAKDIRDTVTFQNPDLRRALVIVADFIRAKKRVCYGGMAINANLPEDLKFYDFTKTLPDYDFFTPNAEADIAELVRELRKEGLRGVEAKLGIHKGTTKIFVDFNAVADITEASESFFNILLRQSIVKEGIHYTSANFLRMAMYLELSRPMGEIERWDKVYKRLYLLNLAVPPVVRGCPRLSVNRLEQEERNTILNYVQQNGLIFAGPELEQLYAKPTQTTDLWLTRGKGPIIAYSQDIFRDINALKGLLSSTPLRVYRWAPTDDFMPFCLGLVHEGSVIVLLVEESACHAYNTFTRKNKSVINIAALDTLITLYYSLGYVRGLEGLANTTFECLADKLVLVSGKTRDAFSPGKFPLFSLSCQGHQPTKESLLRAKKMRIEEFKKIEQERKKERSNKTKKNKK